MSRPRVPPGYTVGGDFDFQNTFGAMLRNHFDCNVSGPHVTLTPLG